MGLWDTIKGWFGVAKDTSTQVAGQVGEKAAPAWDKTREVAGGAVSKGTDVAGGAVSKGAGLASSAYEKGKSAAGAAAGMAGDAIDSVRSRNDTEVESGSPEAATAEDASAPSPLEKVSLEPEQEAVGEVADAPDAPVAADAPAATEGAEPEASDHAAEKITNADDVSIAGDASVADEGDDGSEPS